jgi:ABC-type multidrug transport system ATPase subunit
MRFFLVKVAGGQRGPLAESDLRAAVAAGEIPLDALGLCTGVGAWMPLRELLAEPLAEGPAQTAPVAPDEAATVAPSAPMAATVATAPAPADPAAPPRRQIPPPADGSALVEVNEVTKTFGTKTALHRLTFSIPAGQICGLLGPNGAGKTTLFRLLMGILKATEGSLRVAGLDAFADRVEAKRHIGFLPDEPVFHSYLSGREILELSAAMHGLQVGPALDRLAPVIARLRLTDELRNYAEDYSRGMKKKLGLLLALVHGPRLLVLDEPTNGLDVEATHLFYDLIADEARRGVTVLFSTHLMDQVTKLCSHAVVINHGRMVATGTLAELRAEFGADSLEEAFLKLTARPAPP